MFSTCLSVQDLRDRRKQVCVTPGNANVGFREHSNITSSTVRLLPQVRDQNQAYNTISDRYLLIADNRIHLRRGLVGPLFPVHMRLSSS